MSDLNRPDDGPGRMPGAAIGEVITVLLVLALVAFAGFVLFLPVLMGDF